MYMNDRSLPGEFIIAFVFCASHLTGEWHTLLTSTSRGKNNSNVRNNFPTGYFENPVWSSKCFSGVRVFLYRNHI